jgi:predicted phage baseplate assembly protein
MSCTTSPNDSVCPCETPDFPLEICNLPNLPAIHYRTGDFLAFRYALLQPLDNETALSAWRPGAQGDLAVQMIEWWAYLADILTFYNERIANEDYLGTAVLPESINHLVQLLGYRPRPALGARGTLAALLTPSARPPVTLLPGMQIQSKPGPGQPPQTFELDSQATLQAPDVISADVVPAHTPLLGTNPDGSSYVWLSGKVSGIKHADRLLLINSQALTAQIVKDYAWIMVTGTTAQSDPLGNPVTQVNFSALISTIAAGASADQYSLLRGAQSSPLWPYQPSPMVVRTSKTILTDTSPVSPSLASLGGKLYIAWKGDGNDNLNVMYSSDNGQTFGNKYTSPETSPMYPALTADKANLYIAWKGDGNDFLSVAPVSITGGTINSLSPKTIIENETSPLSPSLASLNGRLYLAWKGDGNDFLNVMYSSDNGQTFGNTYTSSTETSAQAPSLAVHNGTLYITWIGDGNDKLNVAIVTVSGANITGFSNKFTLADTSPLSPSLASFNGRLYIAWKGNGNDYLNVMYSSDNGQTFGNKYTSPETSSQAPSLAVHNNNLYITWTGDGNDELNVAIVTVVGANIVGLSAQTTIDLASVARGVSAGSLVLADVAGGAAAAATNAAAAADLIATPLIAQSYAEVVWYANGNGSTPPASNATNPTPAVAIPHAEIVFASLDATGTWVAAWNANAAQVTIRWGWTSVGSLAPVLQASDLTYFGGTTALVPAPGESAFAPTPASVLLEDPEGNAASAITAQAAAPPGAVTLGTLSTLPSSGLASPIDVFFNLLAISRGKTVATEVLGSGNPTVAGQDFTLQNAPVTYFADTASVSGDGFTSTVHVSVNGVQWSEVQSFYAQPPNAQVFVLREDDSNQTHVMFGDGVNGALLPTGTGNVTATYRYGAGAAEPAAETLTLIQTPQPGLKAVRNPLPPTGGSDPDSPAKLSTLAPRSVLTFNRAVSLDDYSAIALTAAGVTDAVAEFAFDTQSQRPVVTLWVAGDPGAAAAVQAALAGISVPGQGLNIVAATGVPMRLSLNYVRDPRYQDAPVQAGITAALIDPDAGLFGSNVIGIGETFFDSQIEAACLAVPGVTAVHQVQFTTVINIIPLKHWIISRFPFGGRPPVPIGCSGHRYYPGAGSYFTLNSDNLSLAGTPAS